MTIADDISALLGTPVQQDAAIVTPAWKVAAVQQIIAEGGKQIAPYAVGGKEETIVDFRHPTFIFSTDPEKTVMYKQWLIDNGFFSAPPAASSPNDPLGGVTSDLSSVLTASTPAARGVFYIALLGGAALWFFLRKK